MEDTRSETQSKYTELQLEIPEWQNMQKAKTTQFRLEQKGDLEGKNSGQTHKPTKGKQQTNEKINK